MQYDKKTTIKTSVLLPRDQYRQLRVYCAAECISVSEFFREVMDAHLATQRRRKGHAKRT